MRVTIDLARDPRYWRPRTGGAGGSFKDFINHSGNTQVRIIWFKSRNGVQYVANNKDGGWDSGNDVTNGVTNEPSAYKSFMNRWYEDGLVSTNSPIWGTQNTAMQSVQDGPFPLTALGSVDLSAVEVISDHVENINSKIIN